jgi:hypothetical protein
MICGSNFSCNRRFSQRASARMKMTLPVLRDLGKSNNINIPARLSKSLVVDWLLEGCRHLLVHSQIPLNSMSLAIRPSYGHPLDGLTKAHALRRVLQSELHYTLSDCVNFKPLVSRAMAHRQGTCQQGECCLLHG